jgi:hypothetical protein
MGERYGPRLLRILPGVHGYRVLDGPVHLFYIVSQEYDGTDEGGFLTMTRRSAMIGQRGHP